MPVLLQLCPPLSLPPTTLLSKQMLKCLKRWEVGILERRSPSKNKCPLVRRWPQVRECHGAQFIHASGRRLSFAGHRAGNLRTAQTQVSS